MNKILSLVLLLPTLSVLAQKVEISVGGNWAEIPVQQTQSELKPGWKIVDYQMKGKLTHYLSGGHALQLAEGRRPVFRVTPGGKEVLADYAIIRLKATKYYRKMFRPLLIECNYTRLDLNSFEIRAEEEAFVCQPRQPLQAGEYILVDMQQQPVGELQDLLVYPFCVIADR